MPSLENDTLHPNKPPDLGSVAAGEVESFQIVKLFAEIAVNRLPVVTFIVPVVAPSGTSAVIWMFPQVIPVVVWTPLNSTFPFVPADEPKFRPFIVTDVVFVPPPGEKPVIEGVGVGFPPPPSR